MYTAIAHRYPETTSATVLLIRLLLALACMWWGLSYHDSISEFIGARFPWPVSIALKWPALLISAFLIEALVCLPLVYPIALIFGRTAIFASLVFCAPVVLRAAWDISQYRSSPLYGMVLFAFHGICHFAFLVGGTVASRQLLKRGGFIHEVQQSE